MILSAKGDVRYLIVVSGTSDLRVPRRGRTEAVALADNVGLVEGDHPVELMIRVHRDDILEHRVIGPCDAVFEQHEPALDAKGLIVLEDGYGPPVVIVFQKRDHSSGLLLTVRFRLAVHISRSPFSMPLAGDAAMVNSWTVSCGVQLIARPWTHPRPSTSCSWAALWSPRIPLQSLLGGVGGVCVLRVVTVVVSLDLQLIA